MNRISGDWLIVMAALIWGVAFYFQKTAMSHIGPLLFIGLRGGVAALSLLPFVLVEQSRSTVALKRVFPIACLGGVVFYLAGSIQQVGLVTATVTNTGFLTAIYVVMTPLLYWLIKRRRPSNVTWLSVLLAFAGVWALSGGSLQSFSTGDRWVAVSSVFWALLIITTAESSKWSQPMTYTCIKFSTVAILGLASALAFESIQIDAIVQASESIVYVGVLSSALTFAIMAVALKTVPAPRASILLTLETLFAASAGYVLLGERLTLMGWLGATLILAAVVVLKYEASGSSG